MLELLVYALIGTTGIGFAVRWVVAQWRGSPAPEFESFASLAVGVAVVGSLGAGAWLIHRTRRSQKAGSIAPASSADLDL